MRWRAVPSSATIDLPAPLAYLETTFLFSRLLQTYSGVALDYAAQPNNCWINGNSEFGILPEAPVITLRLKGGLWVRFKD